MFTKHYLPDFVFQPGFEFVFEAKVKVMELAAQLWKHIKHFFEFFLSYLANHRIAFWFNCCTSWLAREQRELSKNLRISKTTDVNVVFFDWIFDKHLALPTFHDVNIISLVALYNKGLLRIQKLQVQAVDKKVNG